MVFLIFFQWKMPRIKRGILSAAFPNTAAGNFPCTNVFLNFVETLSELSIASKMLQSVMIWGFVEFGNEPLNITYLPTNFEMELTILSKMSSPKSICVVKGNQYEGEDFMKINLRKEQEKLAVLLEISDAPKKNSDIIKGAESCLIMDEAYTRLLSDKKTSAGKKELQFILYFLKKDEQVNVENRGFYTANEKTAEELIKTARIVDEALKADEKASCILTPEALDEMGLVLLSAYPIQVVPTDVSSGFEIVSLDEATEANEDKKDSDTEMTEENVTSSEQVDKTVKSNKKGKNKKKVKNDSKVNI